MITDQPNELIMKNSYLYEILALGIHGNPIYLPGKVSMGIKNYVFRNTKSGRVIVEYDGFEYRQDRSCESHMVLRCCGYWRSRCLARARIYTKSGLLLVTNDVHNHQPKTVVPFLGQFL